MRKIANTKQLQDELRALICYAAEPRPSRQTLALKLRGLSARVAATMTAAAAIAEIRTKPFTESWLDSLIGRGLKKDTGAKSVTTHNGKRIAEFAQGSDTAKIHIAVYHDRTVVAFLKWPWGGSIPRRVEISSAGKTNGAVYDEILATVKDFAAQSEQMANTPQPYVVPEIKDLELRANHIVYPTLARLVVDARDTSIEKLRERYDEAHQEILELAAEVLKRKP